MGHSRAEKAESRERILDAAARQIREGGTNSVSIAELMKEANLTHGGFYGHFPSRTALIEAAVERALDNGTRDFTSARPSSARDPVKAFLNAYLSPAHRDHPGGGCAFAALATDVGRSDDPGVKRLMAKRFEDAVEHFAKKLGTGANADAASLAAWSTMIGALALSRVLDGPRSDQILKAARQAVLDLAEKVRD